MRRAAIIVLTLVLILALGAAVVNAQGKGRCGRMGQGQAVCPMQQNGQGPAGCPMGPGMGKGMGMGAGMGMGGWWNSVQPQTPQQKQFVGEVSALHNRIRSEQAELNQLKAANANPVRQAALEKDLAALRTRVHDLVWNNQALMQQMGVNCQMGKGACGPNAAKCAQCPNKDNCPCYANGTCTMDPAKCADCPNKDTCPCYNAMKAGQCGTCPKAVQGQMPCKQTCPLTQTK